MSEEPIHTQHRAPTIYEVAAKAGVSIKTVSRVLNREPNVRPAVHDRVTQAVSALGYRPRTSARGLAGGRSFTLVTYLDESLTLEHWRIDRSNPYVERLQFGGMMACREAGYHLLFELLDANAQGAEAAMMSTLSALNPDGVILTPPISDNQRVMKLLTRMGTPFARLSAIKTDIPCLSVTMDEKAGAFEATEHLISLGHRRIGFIAGTPALSSSHAREAGFLAALAKYGLALEKNYLCQGDYTYEGGKAAARRLLQQANPPSAIFAANDEMALGIIHVASEHGVEVPLDLSVVGFDDFQAARYSLPSLTTIRQPVGDMAAQACKRLIAHAAARDEIELNQALPVNHALLVRDSTAPPR
ncbi:LacI family DNA-binding transcriptional regulator [Candidatus Phycosocius spiralis]|uniref:LacI family transcriptional regulator n=1 Tax=Candidatus Phycosocius spiralis TaxID=2815099 RepID=A0ABQ4PYP7_9PROT|nr:LacI family DNA-binding transcriptional regulator [Candidatus Phycosocius spiralis]GIU67794.1 LacI family transcriptional regulator [Candidatus Phycosocius spiralis]